MPRQGEGWEQWAQTEIIRREIASAEPMKISLMPEGLGDRLTPEQKEDYFTHFLESKPVGKIDSRTIEIDCNTAIDVGLYTFSFGDGSQVKARYTYTYKWDGRQWLITSHHSSAMPEKF